MTLQEYVPPPLIQLLECTPLPTILMLFCCLLGSAGSGSFYHSHLRICQGSGSFKLHMHGYKDFNFEHMPRLCQVIKEVKISQGQKGRVTRPCFPITPRILRVMKGLWFSSEVKPSYDNLML